MKKRRAVTLIRLVLGTPHEQKGRNPIRLIVRLVSARIPRCPGVRDPWGETHSNLIGCIGAGALIQRYFTRPCQRPRGRHGVWMRIYWTVCRNACAEPSSFPQKVGPASIDQVTEAPCPPTLLGRPNRPSSDGYSPMITMGAPIPAHGCHRTLVAVDETMT